MNTIKIFAAEIVSFSKRNWWLYIIYFFSIIAIYLLEEESLFTVFLISTGHFIADIFIMMMFSAYNANEDENEIEKEKERRYKLGSYYQLFSMLLFLVLKLIIGFQSGRWYYLSSDLIYGLSAYRNFQLDVKGNNVKFINHRSLSILSIILVGLLCLLFPFFENIWQIIQAIGIYAFGISLSYTGIQKKKHIFQTLALIVMVFGSLAETIYQLLSDGKLSGLDFSYAIFPLTVLVFFLQIIKSYIGDKNNPTDTPTVRPN